MTLTVTNFKKNEKVTSPVINSKSNLLNKTIGSKPLILKKGSGNP